MPWIIKAYIPVEPEDPETYATKEEAEKDVESFARLRRLISRKLRFLKA